MAKPVTDHEREAILVDVNAGKLSRNAIARKHRRSVGTITNIVRDAGLAETAFDRSVTENATRARAVDNASRRERLVSDLLDDVALFRGMFRQEWRKTVVVPGVGEVGVEADSVEIATGLQRLMTSVGIAVDKHVALEKYDAGDQGADDAKSMLLGVADGLRTLYVASGMGDERLPNVDAPDGASN